MHEALQPLPIDAVRERLRAAATRGRVVLAAPTGTGKSTRVPLFCDGRVLVVEPRRVACMTLAERVAAETGTRLGQRVGYWVRDDRRADAETRVLFATPGVVLRARGLLEQSDHVILDEFHERGLETDLLFALLRRDRPRGLVVMSATLQTQAISEALDAERIELDGRSFPVELCHRPDGTLLPSAKQLAERVAAAVDAAIAALDSTPEHARDLLVFLPGKTEIARARDALGGRRDLELVVLHGGLSLSEQRHAFAPARRRKVVLATNVAETSVTVPGVGAVIDSGLVRRTRYHYGRSYLTLTPIAQDSAEQRAGRAGRTGPGLCIRLWDRAARLEPFTPPEIHRESLTGLLLAAAALGADARALPFLDPPHEHALQDARDELQALGGLDAQGRASALGRELFGLPLDPALGRLLLQGRAAGTLDDVIDLVAALSVARPLFSGRAAGADAPEELRDQGCDATALIKAVRIGDPSAHGLNAGALGEARATAERLRRALDQPSAGPADRAIDRAALSRTVLLADARTAHVARKRKRSVAFSNGGTEITLSRDSAVQRGALPEAIAVLAVHAVEDPRAGRMLLCTAAMPLSLALLTEARLGRTRVAGARLKGEQVVATLERVYAKRVLSRADEVPQGEQARESIACLFCEGRLLLAAFERSMERIEALRLAERLRARKLLPPLDEPLPPAPPDLRSWVMQRLEQLGVESGRDAALLSEADLTFDALPYAVERHLEDTYPARLELGDATYRAEYDLTKNRVTLHLIRGGRATAPPRHFLPRFPGMTIFAEAAGRMHRIR